MLPSLQDATIRRHVLTAIKAPSSVLNFGIVVPKFLSDQVTVVLKDFETFRKFSSVKIPDEALVVTEKKFDLEMTVKNCRKPELAYFQLCVENGMDEEFSDFYMQHKDLFNQFPSDLPSIWEAYTVSKWSLAPVTEFTQLWSCCDQCIRHAWNFSLRRILKRSKAEFPDRFHEIQQLALFISLKLEKLESLKVSIQSDPDLAGQATLKKEALEVFADTQSGTSMIGFALSSSNDNEDVFRFFKTFNEGLDEMERQHLTRLFSMYYPDGERKEMALNQIRKMLFE
ncbi:hypothetical protein L596_017438 [Steinernema carpocapsae]|uniref:Uncharacterized protein n=1 Tax=Steinernema carpocapsae TaxID=34508 RepID=A0A4U5N1Y0_STECR|nr:hypothetical protein L596_017438 [Steinernema carpocapsae]